jgi:hypothetical protein
MNTQRVQRLILGLSPIAAALWGLATSACVQPELFCATATGPFAMRLALAPGSADCLGGAQTKVFHVQTFFAQGDGRPEFEKGSVVITDGDLYSEFEAKEAGGVLGPDPFATEKLLHAAGPFAGSDPDSNDRCTIPSLTGMVTLPELPEVPPDPANPDDMGTPGIPASTHAYTWTNAVVEISPSIQGTVLWGDLTYTANGCTATYSAKGVWPANHCEEVNQCFCFNGVVPEDETCEPTGLGLDFVGQIACVEGLCVFNDTLR